MLKGIDVSEHQGVIDWNKVKDAGIEFAILRVGYGDDLSNQDDKYFKRNADECTRLNIPFGVYLYSYAKSVAQAKSEANHVLRLIKGYKLTYPIYLDLEDQETTGKCSNVVIGDIAEMFCELIENEGYFVGIYANTNWFTNKLTDKRFERWTKWIAQYSSSCTYDGECPMWQYTSTGNVDGIDGNVDMNSCYVDYPTIINGMNNKKFNLEEENVMKEEKVTMKKDEVVEGSNARSNRLDESGIIIFSNSVDQRAAEYMSDYLGYPTTPSWFSSNYSYYDREKIFAVGGTKGTYTSYLLDRNFISGSDRYETLKAMLRFIGKL